MIVCDLVTLGIRSIFFLLLKQYSIWLMMGCGTVATTILQMIIHPYRNLNLRQSLQLAKLSDLPTCYYYYYCCCYHLQRLFHERNWVQNGQRFLEPRDGPVAVAVRRHCCWHRHSWKRSHSPPRHKKTHACCGGCAFPPSGFFEW